MIRQLLLSTLMVTLVLNGNAKESADVVPEQWTSFVSIDQLKSRLGEAGVVVIDARSAEAYAEGHIPGAISLPGSSWRTAKAKPGEGDSQYIFRQADQSPDIPRYEALLGAAGLTAKNEIYVYGNHAGKADGSIPAMILSWLGVEKVAFVDGIALDLWQSAGGEISTEAMVLPEAEFVASEEPGFVMNLDDVLAGTSDDSVVFLDTRSLAEFTGEDPRSNTRGGHIPGATRIDYADLLMETKQVKSPAEVAAVFAEESVPKDKPICLYCQTATRVSLHYLALKDLGYRNVRVYDASWHEYGNLPDTPIAK